MSEENTNTVETQEAPASTIEAAEQNVAQEGQPTEKAPDLSEKFAALSRKEKAIKDREAEVEAKLAEFQRQQEEYKQSLNTETKEKEVPLDWKLKTDPIGTLKEMGYDLNDITELYLNEGKLTPEQELRLLKEQISNKDKQYNSKIEEEIQALREEYAKDKEAQAEQEYEQVVQGFMSDITDTMNSSEDYELCRAEDASDLVFEVIQQHHENTGEVLDVKDALEYTENFLLEQYKERLSGAKKLKSIFGEQSPQTPQELLERKSQTTLSNTLASQVPTREKRPLTEDDYKKQAAAAIKFLDR